MKRLLFFFLLFSALLAQAARPKVGLVLGGGGAMGAAQVGVLKVLQEEGIPIDCIAGTSIGAIVGGLTAIGYTAPQLDSLFRGQDWLALLSDYEADGADEAYTERDGAPTVFGVPVSIFDENGFGLVQGKKVLQLLNTLAGRYQKVDNFDRLHIPFRAVAVDVRTMQEVWLGRGSLPIAMRASMSIPGFFKPVASGERLYVDGGLLNNLPVDVARSMGADLTIVIDLSQRERVPEDTGLTGLLNRLMNAPGAEKYRTNRAAADVYINPELPEFSLTSFSRTDIATMIARGEAAARQALPRLRALKKQLAAAAP